MKLSDLKKSITKLIYYESKRYGASLKKSGDGYILSMEGTGVVALKIGKITYPRDYLGIGYKKSDDHHMCELTSVYQDSFADLVLKGEGNITVGKVIEHEEAIYESKKQELNQEILKYLETQGCVPSNESILELGQKLHDEISKGSGLISWKPIKGMVALNSLSMNMVRNNLQELLSEYILHDESLFADKISEEDLKWVASRVSKRAKGLLKHKDVWEVNLSTPEARDDFYNSISD